MATVIFFCDRPGWCVYSVGTLPLALVLLAGFEPTQLALVAAARLCYVRHLISEVFALRTKAIHNRTREDG